MTKRSLGFILMAAGACSYGAGCSSSSTSGTGGSPGTGGSNAGMGGHAGTGGANPGTGGTNPGTGGTNPGTGGSNIDASADGGDTAASATFTQVFAILSNVTTPTPDTSPGCAHCHDGLQPETGPLLPHSLNFTDKAIAFQQLVGVTSLRCGGADGGTALKRIMASDPAASVLVQKVRQGRGIGTACDNVGMPLSFPVPVADGGPDAGADAGFMPSNHYAVSMDQLNTIVAWVTAGAPNN